MYIFFEHLEMGEDWGRIWNHINKSARVSSMDIMHNEILTQPWPTQVNTKSVPDHMLAQTLPRLLNDM